MKQENLIPVPETKDEEKVDDKKLFACNEHKHAVETDFIEVKIKSSGIVIRRCRFCEKTKRFNKMIMQQDWEREKKNVTDYYVRRMFVTGRKKILSMEDYPQELIDAQRENIKLKRMIKEQTEILKKCDIHGDLKRDQVVKRDKDKEGKILWRCKECLHKCQKNHYKKNKDKILEKHKNYRKENTEVVALIRKNYYEKVKDTKEYKANYRKNARARDRKKTEELADGYIKKLLVRGSSLQYKDIPDELVKLGRDIYKLKRIMKNRKKR